MMRKHVKKEIGLSVVIGAFVFSWFAVGHPTLQALQEYPAAVQASLVQTDFDRDGIPDNVDVRPFDR